MKKNIRLLLRIAVVVCLLISAIAVFSGEAKTERPSDAVMVQKSDMRIFGGSRTIHSGEVVERNVVVMGGDLEIEEDAVIRGDLTLYGGDIEVQHGATVKGTVRVYGGTILIDGTVMGDLYVVGGEAELMDRAVVNGEIKSVGGDVDRANGSRVYGSVHHDYLDDGDEHSGFFGWHAIRRLPIIGGMFRLGEMFSFFWRVVLLGFVAFLLMTFIPNRVVEAESYLAKDKLILTGVIGFAGLIVLPLGMVGTAVTLILIPVTILLLLAYIAANLMGFVILGSILGRDLGRRTQLKWKPIWLTVLGTAVLALAWWVFEMLPSYIEWIPQVVMLSIGFGAAAQYIYEKTLGEHKSLSFTAKVRYNGQTPFEAKIRQSSDEPKDNAAPDRTIDAVEAAVPDEADRSQKSANREDNASVLK